MGCGEKEAPGVVRRYHGIDLKRCPARHLKIHAPWVWAYVDLYQAWKQGRPLVSPVYLDEPARMIDAMRVIDQEVEDLERQRTDSPAPGGAAPGAIGSPYAPRPSTGPGSGRRR